MNHALGKRPKNIRSQNKKIIIDLYRSKGTLSVSEIAGLVSLSRTTVAKINDELLGEQIIVEAGKGTSTDEGGKKPNVFCLKAQKSLILTFYIHYRAIDFCLFDLQGKPMQKAEKAIEANEPVPSILTKMRSLFKENVIDQEDSSRFLACVVGVHCNMDSERGIALHATYFPSWGLNAPLRDKIVEALRLECPVYVENFIRIKAFAELKMGLAKGHSSALLIDAGWHGVTSGIVIGETLYPGKHSLSGEIGHMILNPFDTERCGCGGIGCFESLVSCRRLLQKTERELIAERDSVLAVRRKKVAIQDIFAAAESGDPLARRLLDEVIAWFAQGVSNLITVFDPEIIIISGDYAAAGTYFQDELCRRAKSLSLLRLVRETPVVFSSSESISETVLNGAAAIAIAKYFN